MKESLAEARRQAEAWKNQLVLGTRVGRSRIQKKEIKREIEALNRAQKERRRKKGGIRIERKEIRKEEILKSVKRDKEEMRRDPEG